MKLRQERPRSRAHGGRISAVDEAIGVHIRAEVRRVGRLTGAAARLRGVAGVDEAIAVGVADEHAHGHNKVARAGAVADADNVTVILCALVTPVRLTVIVVVPPPLLPLTDPAPAVTAALLNVTALGKVKTTW